MTMSAIQAVLLGAVLASGAAPPARKPTFKVVYEEAKKPELEPLVAKMKERRILEGAAAMLGALRLPRSITLKGASCGESNAWYDSDTDVITFCYELVRDFVKGAGKSERFNLTPEQAVIGPFLFIVLHETAHAVFAVLAIPVLGREEDAADQVATLAAIRVGGDFAERMLRAAAFMYEQDSAARKVGEEDFADVHGLDRQRYYNVLCLAWGSDPKRFAFAKELGKLPDDRAEGCADEFAQVRYAVKKLISKNVDQKEVEAIRAKAHRSKFGR
jgi:Putative metallopeptidase